MWQPYLGVRPLCLLHDAVDDVERGLPHQQVLVHQVVGEDGDGPHWEVYVVPGQGLQQGQQGGGQDGKEVRKGVKEERKDQKEVTKEGGKEGLEGDKEGREGGKNGWQGGKQGSRISPEHCTEHGKG